MDKEIKVSISCLVYNHEKYIKKCLDGLLMQKTNFNFEILIHDDASTDKSPDIIREYEAKYPEVIKPIYQTENQYSKGIKIGFTYQYPRAKGKYIAFCEGDDYWCDENKLQRQFDAMESYNNAVFCACKVKVIDENGCDKERCWPEKEINQTIVSQEQMMQLMVEHKSYPFQTSGYFIRRDVLIEMAKEPPKFVQAANVGDIPMMLYCITKGDFIYLNDTMSCYRRMSIGGWNERNNSTERRIIQKKIEIAMWIMFDVFSKGTYAPHVRKVIEYQEYCIYQFENDYKNICNRKYKWLLKQETFKQKAFYHLAAYVPGFSNFYKKLK